VWGRRKSYLSQIEGAALELRHWGEGYPAFHGSKKEMIYLVWKQRWKDNSRKPGIFFLRGGGGLSLKHSQ